MRIRETFFKSPSAGLILAGDRLPATAGEGRP